MASAVVAATLDFGADLGVPGRLEKFLGALTARYEGAEVGTTAAGRGGRTVESRGRGLVP